MIGRRSRGEMIGVFLALLEMIRDKKILCHQADPLGEMEIEVAPASHQVINANPA
jgi:chromatin segregation and condensation protein Rec8/ScpA/Scc1 (kleisin family)